MTEEKKAEKPSKVKVVLVVPTQNASRGDVVSVEADVADRLVANNQARRV